MPCAHSGCRCVETPVKKGALAFCSDRCASLHGTEKGGTHAGACPCGHAECRPSART
jgi:hypothetical protein